LDEIKSKSSWAEKNVGYVLQPFSALLVRLSRDAEQTAASVNKKTQTLIVLTRILVVMTGILIFLTIPLVVFEGNKFVAEFFPLYKTEHGNHTNQNGQQSEAAKKADQILPTSVAEPVNQPALKAVGPPAKEKGE
jgi:hypothetical protein